jgi:hypothetical protein
VKDKNFSILRSVFYSGYSAAFEKKLQCSWMWRPISAVSGPQEGEEGRSQVQGQSGQLRKTLSQDHTYKRQEVVKYLLLMPEALD